MAFTLTALPFPKESLDPTMSARTLEHHREKHHAAYVKKLNELVADTKLANADLETLIRTSAKSLRQKEPDKHRRIFDNASQVWNHDFSSSKARSPGRRTVSLQASSCHRSSRARRHA